MLVAGAVWANQPPVVDLLSASPSVVMPGETTTITVEAHDPDCSGTCVEGCGQYIRSDLTSWTASSGALLTTDNGVSASPYSASAVWQAPAAEGSATVTVTLADSGGLMCGGRASTTVELVVQVSSAAGGPPVIESLTAVPATVLPDQQSQLECQAVDPEGGPITYSWTTDGGVVTPGPGGTASFTSSSPGAVSVVCTATDDSGLWATASVAVAVSAALAEKSLRQGLVTPQRAAVTSWGDVFVADHRGGGVAAVNLFTGAFVYRLPLPGITSLDVDWQDHLVVAHQAGAEVRTRAGGVLLTLASSVAPGPIADVAADPANHRYGVLHRSSGRVELFDETGGLIAGFGSTGDGPGQLKSPGGIAFTPAGAIVVADSGHGEVKVFDPSGALVGSMGGPGGGAGEFVQLADVAVDLQGRIYASDSYQDWVHVFSPDGVLLDTLGTYGDGVGQLKTAAGVAAADAVGRVLVVSLNGSSLEVFRSSDVAPGAGPEPVPSVSPSRLTFDALPVGTVGPPQAVVLRNLGSAPLGIPQVRLDAGFLSSDDCGPYLDAGQSCTFHVRFAPDRIGAVTGSLAIETSAVGTMTAVALEGVALAPGRLGLAPTQIDFGDQQVGSESAPRQLVLSNSGGQPLQLVAVQVSNGFGIASTCPVLLSPSESCTVEVTFMPAGAVGPVAGTLAVISRSPGSPHLVDLRGRAVPQSVVVSIDDAEPVGEGGGRAVLRVELSAPGAGPITVGWVTENGTAVEGEDFVAAGGTVEVPAGAVEVELPVDLLDDDLLEPDEESFWVRLTGVDGASLGDDLARVAVRDDELCPSPNLLANPDAEDDPSGAGIAGWTSLSNQGWQVVTSDPEPHQGRAAFAAPAQPGAELTQAVDVSSWLAAIDAGDQEFAVEGHVRTEGNGRAELVVDYLEGDGITLLDRFDSGEIVTGEGWQRVVDLRTAPPLTRQIRVRLLATDDGGDEATVFFDHLALVALRTQTAWIASLAVAEGDVGVVDAEVVAMLACRQAREVELVLSTRDGTATAGEDYLASSTTVRIVPGQLEASMPVTVLGDTLEEGHEEFGLELDVLSGGAVPLPGAASGVILDDDRCPRSASWWVENPHVWPDQTLRLGGAEYTAGELTEWLQADHSDLASEVARELAAAKLNVAFGSPRTIEELLAAADDYLVRFPPGSEPRGSAEAAGRELRDRLAQYNDTPCQRPRRVGRR